ncbi:helix-turn-helix domain-containing protein [Chitinophaga sp. RAB17]|uniref:helix-turn-helix domain-containing protein n=1 Tax=Chitinophaga sp. RAB17 TaxID=3233049 RepID=UPI003F8FD63B
MRGFVVELKCGLLGSSGYLWSVCKHRSDQYNIVATFVKRVRECREAKSLSQQELAKQMKTSYTVVGKYERDEKCILYALDAMINNVKFKAIQ